jgi:hypothetical protein
MKMLRTQRCGLSMEVSYCPAKNKLSDIKNSSPQRKASKPLEASSTLVGKGLPPGMRIRKDT